MPELQQPPNSIQIELSVGCNLACSFCGINNVEIPVRKFMTPDTASRIAANIARTGWRSRIEFALRGEPSLNPNRLDVIRAIRKELPKSSLMMLSNGVGFIKNPVESVRAILDAGLNTLCLERYEGINYGQRIASAWLAAGERVTEYPTDRSGNPHQRFMGKRVVMVADIAKETQGTHRTPNNHAGYGADPVEYNKPCARPFREVSISYDGAVKMCCIAWAGEMRCGNAAQTELVEIWNNERFFAVRQKLLRGERDFGLCDGCDQPSFRVGLLPDPAGKKKDMYPPADETTMRIINEMIAEGTELQQTPLYLQRKADWKARR